MPTTFAPYIYRDAPKKDGTYPVKIRITHRRVSVKVPTNMFCEARDLTRAGEIKNTEIIDECNEIIRRWRREVLRLGARAEMLTARQLANHLRGSDALGAPWSLNFTDYGRKITAGRPTNTRKYYWTAMSALDRYMSGEVLDIGAITTRFVQNFEQWLRDEPVLKPRRGSDAKDDGVPMRGKGNGRAISSYIAAMKHIHALACAEFNDEDLGITRIPLSPFSKYKVPKPPRPKRRAVGSEVIQAVIDLPDKPRDFYLGRGFVSRDLARDCFLLSFGLAGMNAADLYDTAGGRLRGGGSVIVYNRKKTRDRREDSAEMRIRIEEEIRPLVDKYADPTGERLFCFHSHFSNADAFTMALSYGMKQVVGAITSMREDDDDGERDSVMTFYSARHTWATLARSAALRIDKYTVHEALNHVDAEMRMTDRYIERDWSTIWDANARVVGLLDWSAVKEREAARGDDPAARGGSGRPGPKNRRE